MAKARSQSKPVSEFRLIGKWKPDVPRIMESYQPEKKASEYDAMALEMVYRSTEVDWTAEKCIMQFSAIPFPSNYKVISEDETSAIVDVDISLGKPNGERLTVHFEGNSTYWVQRDDLREYFNRVRESRASAKLRPESEFVTKAKRIADKSKILKDLGAPLTLVNFDDVNDAVTASLVIYELPDVRFPSGKVCASDGFIMSGKPFTRDFKPGKYPVQLLIQKFSNDERIAFAKLELAARPVDRWELAVTKAQKVSKLKPGEFYGYGVDSGTGCFFDPAAQKLLNQTEMGFFQRVISEMENSYKNTRSWVRIDTEQGSAALFSSGIGDGFYASYFGLDKQGIPVALLTDFGIVNWPRRPDIA